MCAQSYISNKKQKYYDYKALFICKVAQRKLKIGFQHEIHKIGSLAQDYHHPFVLLRDGRRVSFAPRHVPSVTDKTCRRVSGLAKPSAKPRLPTRNEF